MRERTNTLSIKTPEGIVFSFLLAGPVTRFLAWIIDVAVIVVLVSTVLYLASLAGGLAGIVLEGAGEWAAAAAVVGYFVITVCYSMILEWAWRGQTVGKRVLRLRVVDENGLRLQFSQLAIRNLMRIVDGLPPWFYVVGGVACLVSRRSQRLGDFAANTVVIRTPKAAEPDLDQALSGKYNSLRDYPHLEARLRQRVSPEETRIALQALLRRDELDPQARIEVFAEIADHFRSLVEFPEEATVGVADEQYVRNVVDVIFRPKGAREPVSGAVSAPAGLPR